MSPERRGDSVRKKGKAEMSGEEVTAMELAGAQINANGGRWEGRGPARGCARRQRLSQNGECPRPRQETSSPGGPPGAPEPTCPAVPSLLPALGSAPPSTRRGWEKMAQTFEGGTKVPTAACGRKCPALGKGAEDTVWREAAAPCLAASPTTSGLRSTPCPSPQPPRLQPRGLRSGEGHLWWFARRGRRGGEGKPKAGLAEGLTGLHHSCLRALQP